VLKRKLQIESFCVHLTYVFSKTSPYILFFFFLFFYFLFLHFFRCHFFSSHYFPIFLAKCFCLLLVLASEHFCFQPRICNAIFSRTLAAAFGSLRLNDKSLYFCVFFSSFRIQFSLRIRNTYVKNQFSNNFSFHFLHDVTYWWINYTISRVCAIIYCCLLYNIWLLWRRVLLCCYINQLIHVAMVL